MDDPQFSVQGFPARFAAVRAFDTVLSHSITADVHPNHCYVLQGVDASVHRTISPVNSGDAWISLGSPGTKMIFGAGDYVDGGDNGCFTWSWRGSLPFYVPDVLEVGVECSLGSDLALHAWGVWLPLPLLISL
jgi:hypothetical protein